MAMVDLEPQFVVTPRRCRVAHAWITNEMYAQLEAEAGRQRCHPDELVAQIVESVLDGGFVDLVLAP